MILRGRQLGYSVGIEKGKDRFYIENAEFWDWILVGNGEKYDDCGELRLDKFRGCLEVGKHSQTKIDGVNASGLIELRIFVRSCDRAECPIDYEKWAGKLATKVAFRFEDFEKFRKNKFKGYKLKTIHLSVSLPKDEWYKCKNIEDFRLLRRKVYNMIMGMGIKGGMLLFHAFRFEKKYGIPYFSPHFHVLCIGWLRNGAVEENFEECGYVVTNHGLRLSNFVTAFYQLSHASIRSGVHTVAWFGNMSYRKFHAREFKADKEKCSICGSDYKNLEYDGDIEKFLEKYLIKKGGKYYVSPVGWSVKDYSEFYK